MQQPLLLTTRMQPVPEPIMCRSCYAHTVADKTESCDRCKEKNRNLADAALDRMRRRVLIGGLFLASLMLLVFIAAVIRGV